MPEILIVTFGTQDSLELLPRLMRLGVRDHLKLPTSAAVLTEAADSARRRLHTHPPAQMKSSDLYTFLPAKPGVGTSTIALSTSCAMAEAMDARTFIDGLRLGCGRDSVSKRFGDRRRQSRK